MRKLKLLIISALILLIGGTTVYASLGEYLGGGTAVTKLLFHLNGDSTDSSGNGKIATSTSVTYSYANGLFNQGGSFASSSPSKIVGTAISYGSITNVTLSVWAKWTATTRGDIVDIYKSDFSQELQLLQNQNNGSVAAGYVTCNLFYSAANHFAITPTNGYNDGKWHNIICVVSGSSKFLYLDGNSVATNTAAGTSLSYDYLSIGYDNHNSVNGFNGQLDEIIFENQAWTAQQVSRYYTYAKGRFGITH